MTDSDTARKALEILDSDGWCKDHLTFPGFYAMTLTGDPFPWRTGSHCIGGAVNIAMHGNEDWQLPGTADFYRRLADVIREQYPEFRAPATLMIGPEARAGTEDILFIATWNNARETTEADVRRILEKIAAG
jgi:hypothetical protein